MDELGAKKTNISAATSGGGLFRRRWNENCGSDGEDAVASRIVRIVKPS